MKKIKVFGLNLLGKRVSESLIIDVKNKNNPDKWNWTPNKPNKIKNIHEHIKKEKEATDYAIITNYNPNKTKHCTYVCYGKFVL